MKLLGILVSSVLSAPVVLAVSITELDDFNAPSGAPNPQESWLEGGGSTTPPSQQLTGGPDGSGFLIDSSTGISPGKRMQLWNTDQWTGDYLGQSISTLSLDAINLSGEGNETINLRVALNGPGGWFVTGPQVLLPETGWQSLLFDLSPTGLVHAGQGDAVYDSTMAAVNRLQIISLEEDTFNIGGNAGLRGDTIVATLGLDNIRAGEAIPEPSGAALILMGCAGLMRRRRQRVK